MGVEEAEGLEEVIESGFVCLGLRGGAVDLRDDVACHDFLEEREGFEAEAIASGNGESVGVVFAVGDFALCKPGIDLAAPDVEERAEEGDCFATEFEFQLGDHSFQARRATQELEEDGLGVVIGVYGYLLVIMITVPRTVSPEEEYWGSSARPQETLSRIDI